MTYGPPGPVSAFARPLLFKSSERALEWMHEHMHHHPGIKVTAKQSRCLGCGSRLKERLEVEPLTTAPRP